MKKQAPLLVLLVVALGVLLWLVLSPEEEEPIPAIDSTADRAVPVVPEPDGLEDVSLPAAETGGDEVVEEERHEVAVTGAREEDRSFEVEGADGLDVILRMPAGAEPDPTLRLFAVYPTPSAGFEENMLPWITREILDGDRESRARFSGGGFHWALRNVPDSHELRLPIPPRAETVWLQLSGQYLFLGVEERLISRDGGPLVVEPELGARLTGRFHLPPEAAERAITADAFNVLIEGQPRDGERDDDDGNPFASWMGMRGGERAEVSADLTFEYRGLDTSRLYSLYADIDGLLDAAEGEIDLVPGEHRVLEIEVPPGASVSGRVLGEGRASIEHAHVSASTAPTSRFTRHDGVSDYSDDQGRYTLHGLAAGEVQLAASAEGWLDSEPTSVVVGDVGTVTAPDIVLGRGHRLGGIVVWPDGSPAGKARVSITAMEDAGRMRWKDTVGSARADEDGRFEVSGLQDGPFEIKASCNPPTREEGDAGEEAGLDDLQPPVVDTMDGLPLALWDALESSGDSPWRGIVRDVGPDTLDLRVVLAEPLGFPGRVVDDTGAPVPVFEIEAQPEPRSPTGWSPDEENDDFDTADGTFFMSGLYEGDWGVTARAPGFTEMDDPVVVTIPFAGDPVVITLTRTASVSGVVVDPSGSPVSGAKVVPSSGDVPAFAYGFPGAGSETDASGRFTIDDVDPVGLALVASHEDWATSEATPVEAEPGARLAEVVLRLRVGGRITGEVLDDDGHPVVGQNVVCGPGAMAMGFGGESSTTDASGHFAFDHVTPGKVTVSAMPSEEEMMSAAESSGADQVRMIELMSQIKMETVVVADGEEVHVILGSEPKEPVRVHGRVTAAREPVVDGQVFAVAEGGALMEGMKIAAIDEQGDYELTVDRPGAYVLYVGREGADGPGIPFYVDVPEVAEHRQDLALPTAAVTGHVFGPDGSPAAGISLRIDQEDGILGMGDLDESRVQRTETDGSYLFDSLAPGSYAIHVGPSGPFFLGAESSPYGATVVSGIEVEEGRVITDVDIHLSGGGDLTGVVRDDAGKPVAGATIFVRSANGRWISGISRCMTDAAGRYTYRDLAPGRVTVAAQKGELTCADHGPVTIAEGGAAELDLVLVAGAVLEISSLVDGEPVRATVYVLDESGRQLGGRLAAADLESLITEGFSSRVCKVGPVPPGRYEVVGTTAEGHHAKRSVTVRVGQTTRKVKLRLK